MADLVTVQTIENGPRWLVMRFTNVSDGTGEAGVLKVNAASANGVIIQGQTIYPGVHLKIREVQYDVKGMGLRLQWQATTPVDILVLEGCDHQSFDRFGGIPNPGVGALPGATGSILFTTIGATANASYSLVMRMSKGIPQS